MCKTLEFLYSLRNQGSKFGIERMETFCLQLGNPHLSFPSIHVAGTNGKGSVCTMLERIYRADGYRVGLFTSPHLIELGERIRVDGKNLSFQEIEQWVDQLHPIAQKMEKTEKGMTPTFFEFMTAMAFLQFKKEQVDLAIVETGLGGRLDSTNVLNSEISVITTVGYDHCELLGYELKNIAAEKAGIIKQGKPVVVGWLDPDAKDEICRIARGKNAKIYAMDETKESSLPTTNLKGAFQRKNAAIARRVVDLLHDQFPVEESKVLKAFEWIEFPGRWQRISTKPTIILDACHNGLGAQESQDLWDQLPKGFQVWFAACGEDRARDVLTPLLMRTKDITLFELDQPRACTHRELLSAIQKFPGSVKLAFQKEISGLCQQLDTQTTLLVTGSIYLVGAVLSHFTKPSNSASQRNWQDTW